MAGHRLKQVQKTSSAGLEGEPLALFLAEIRLHLP